MLFNVLGTPVLSFLFQNSAQSVGAAEYANCISAEGVRPPAQQVS